MQSPGSASPQPGTSPWWLRGSPDPRHHLSSPDCPSPRCGPRQMWASVMGVGGPGPGGVAQRRHQRRHLCQTCPVMSCACALWLALWVHIMGSRFLLHLLLTAVTVFAGKPLQILWQVQAERVAGGAGPRDGQGPWLPAAEGAPREQHWAVALGLTKAGCPWT